MKRRMPAYILVLALLLCLALPAGAAGPELSIRGPDQVPGVGESFSVTVEITGNPGICSFQFFLSFDLSLLECVSMENGPAAGEAMAVSNPKADNGARFALATTEPLMQDGVICTLNFTVLKAASEYRFTLSSIRMRNGDSEKVDLPVPGELVVSGTADVPAGSGESQDPGPTEQPEQPEEGGEEPAPAVSFTDIDGHWGAEYVRKAAERKLFDGYPDGTFKPDNEVTRGQFVTVLWRMAGSPAPSGPASFSDVPAGQWYSDAVAWASEKGYVNGYPDGTFRPGDSLTREQAMKILFGYHGGVSGEELLRFGIYNASFADSGEISDWAKSAMYWAYYNELIKGTSLDPPTLSPKATATRAQIAVILVNYADKLAV